MKLTVPDPKVVAAMLALQAEYREAKNTCQLSESLESNPEWATLPLATQAELVHAQGMFQGYLMGVAKGIQVIREHTDVIGWVI